MDGLAEKVRLDPLELRLRNQSAMDPEQNVPFSTRRQVACMQDGAKRFGWAKRNAKPQATGAMIWGVGAALHEHAVTDPRYRFFVNHDLGSYRVPCHTDIPAIEAHFLPEVDDKTNPLKIKGVGELRICGAGASIANAVYSPCGLRIHKYSVTMDKVLARLEQQRA